MTRSAYSTIRLNHLQYNLNIVRGISPHSKLMAVIKADAYGHGMLPVAEALQEAVQKGIGPAKAFGCGLLSLAPAA